MDTSLEHIQALKEPSCWERCKANEEEEDGMAG